MKRGKILAAIFLPMFLMTVGWAVQGVYPFGEKSALVINGVHQYLPFYTEWYRKIHEGESLFYSWRGGLGMNFWAVAVYYLSSPMNLLGLLFPEGFLNEALTLIILIKIGLCGGTMTWYLQDRKEKKEGRDGVPLKAGAGLETREICIGTCYALSGYVIGYYENFMWLDGVLILPVIVGGIERLVRRQGAGLYTWGLFYGIMSNPYIGFMLCLFSVLYFLKELYVSRPKGKGRIMALFMWQSMFAGLANAWLFLPFLLALKDTKSADTLEFTFSLENFGNGKEILLGLFDGLHPVVTSADQGRVNLYCGILVPFLAVGWYLFSKEEKRERRASAGLLLLIFASFFFKSLNLVFHGGHAPVGFPNRQAFLAIFLLLKGAYESLGKRRLAGRLSWIVLPALFLDIGVHTAAGIQNVGTAERNQYLDEKERVEAQGKGGELERTTIQEAGLRNKELWYGLYGVSLFSSTVYSWELELFQELGLWTAANTCLYQGATELTDEMMGVRYVWDGNRMVENPGYGGIGFWAERTLEEWEGRGRNPFEVQEKFVNLAFKKKLYDIQSFELGAGEELSFAEKPGETAYLWTKDRGAVWGDGKKRREAAKVQGVLKVRNEGERRMRLYHAAYPRERMEKLWKDWKRRSFEVKEFDERSLKGSCSGKGGILYLAIPYDKGWKVKVDGKEAKALAIGNTFLGVEILEGEHEVELYYQLRGFQEGVWISLAALVGIGGGFWIFRTNIGGQRINYFRDSLNT